MPAQLIQALYNIVDILFVGRYSALGLTALSIIYPVQLPMIALGVGAGVAVPVGAALWLILAVAGYLAMPAYAPMSTKDLQVIGHIVCMFGLGLFLESMCTKVLQAEGDMKTPCSPRLPERPGTFCWIRC